MKRTIDIYHIYDFVLKGDLSKNSEFWFLLYDLSWPFDVRDAREYASKRFKTEDQRENAVNKLAEWNDVYRDHP